MVGAAADAVVVVAVIAETVAATAATGKLFS
jgi:hypothetical protein